MRFAYLLIPALLTACASPQERCIAEVTRDARVLDQLITDTRGNLNRGFALEEQQQVVTRTDTCTGRNADGTTFRFRCEETDTISRQVPVAIDLNAEREKLESLLQRQSQNRANAQASVAQCRAQFPDEA